MHSCEAPEQRLCFFLLGRLHARRGDHELLGLDGRKAQELASYLLLFRERWHHREVLADVLWQKGTGPQLRKYLRQTLWQLRKWEAGQGGPSGLLCTDGEWVRISAETDVWLDVAELERAYVRTRDVQGEHLQEAEAERVRAAVGLYEGDLFEGCYQDWCVIERERLKTMHLLLLEKLLVYCQERGQLREGIGYGHQILRRDRAHEATHRRLMRLYHLMDDRTAALRQFHACVDALQQELSVDPAPSTRELYGRIRDADGALAASASQERELQGIVEELAKLSPSAPAGDEQALEDLLTVLGEASTRVTQQLFGLRGQAT
jgi:DNA-binding SARP family transcriptional activator